MANNQTIKGSNVIQYYNTLQERKDTVYPIKVSLAIAYNLKMLEPLNEIVNNARLKVAEKFGKRDENGNLIIDGNTIPIQDDMKDEANERLATISDEEFFIQGFKKIKMEDFTGITELKPSDIIDISFMLED